MREAGNVPGTYRISENSTETEPYDNIPVLLFIIVSKIWLRNLNEISPCIMQRQQRPDWRIVKKAHSPTNHGRPASPPENKRCFYSNPRVARSAKGPWRLFCSQ